MRDIEMTNETWSRLLDLRSGRRDTGPFDDAAMALYGPIAAARGSFVLAQVGQSLDGRVSTPAGDSRDISGTDGLAHLHRCRALVDAVLVGVGTVKADDPRLSVRMVEGPDPVRVVVDCRSELTGDEGIFGDGGAPVILLQASSAPRRTYKGAEVVRLPLRASGLDPLDILNALEERSLKRILVEGGARTIARFIDHGLIDRLHVAVAPVIIGSGPMGISLSPIARLSEAHRPRTDIYALGTDVLFDCQLRPAEASFGQGEQVLMAHHA